MDGPFTLEELAAQTNVAPIRIREWVELGLLSAGGDGRYDLDAAERVRLLRFTSDRGVTAEAIAELSVRRDDDILGRYVDLLGGGRQVVGGLADAANDLGLEPALLRRMWTASGFGAQSEVFAEDVPAIQAFTTALDAGLPPEAVIQMVRVFGDALGRVADAENRLFHFYVHEQLRSEGMSHREAFEATEGASEALLRIVEDTVLYFHRKAWHRALREDLLLHLVDDLASPDRPVGQLRIAVLFVDLASFTTLTDTMGDEAAAEVLDRFSDLVRDAAAECDGRVLKQIGDEFMLVFPNGRAAVRCGLRVAEHVALEQHFPAVRMGAHVGPALFRDADYLGATVNLAARIVAEADRSQFLVSSAVRDDAEAMDWVRFEAIGARAVKGVSEPVALFVVATDRPLARQIDPVCGMELDPDIATVRLDHVGTTVCFCSSSCRDLFLEDPNRYAAR